MATRAQAKAAVDAAAVAIKAEMDGFPNGFNYVDGKIDFAPTRWFIKGEAPDKATADSWAASISTFLASIGRQRTIRTEGFYNDEGVLESVITIVAPPGITQIHF